MTWLKHYFAQHARALTETLVQWRYAPVNVLLTIAVIGIALTLPTGLYLAIANVERVTEGWDTGGRISLFLKREVNDAGAQRLAERVRSRRGVARVETISPAEGLAEFRRYSGFGDALDTIDHNPLPTVLVVYPLKDHATATALATLAADFQTRPEVEFAQLDRAWVERLHAMLDMATRAVRVLAGLLGIAVLLVVGNTMRLAIANRRNEIEVVKLVGGTDAFIRRPFLYAGSLQGLLGALLAWMILATTGLVLATPIRSLATLYASNFELVGLNVPEALVLGLIGAGLGWLGARLAVGRHLYAMDPE